MTDKEKTIKKVKQVLKDKYNRYHCAENCRECEFNDNDLQCAIVYALSILYNASSKCNESEILTELYKVANESVDKTLTLTAEDIKLIAKRYGVKIEELQ